MEPYDVYHPDLKANLFRDEIDENHWMGDTSRESSDGFFVKFVNHNYNKFSREYGCAVTIHRRRTIDARDIWLDDCRRALEKLHTSTEIDEFKTAGFLAYWLRRRCVVDNVAPTLRVVGTPPTNTEIEFIKYANEICAFDLGFHFCIRFQALDAADARRIRLDHAFIRESAAFMSTKNVSRTRCTLFIGRSSLPSESSDAFTDTPMSIRSSDSPARTAPQTACKALWSVFRVRP